jgi:hypothetical protein
VAESTISAWTEARSLPDFVISFGMFLCSSRKFARLDINTNDALDLIQEEFQGNLLERKTANFNDIVLLEQ